MKRADPRVGSTANARPRKARPTQADVARLAGVSQALVSYVLNGNTVSATPSTRRRIVEAVERLGYVPHGAARSLRTQRTMTVALVVPDITNPFYPEVQRGVQEVANQHGYQVMTFNTDGETRKLHNTCTAILETGADGSVICDLHKLSDDVRLLVSTGVPVTYVGSGVNVDEFVDRVSIDNVEAARRATDYLAVRDYDRIATIAGPPDTAVGADRLTGFLQGLRDAGRPPDLAEVVYGDFTFESGSSAMRELIAARGRPPGAVFAANDLMALGAMQALHEEGFAVPTDTALVGFDDIAAARMVTPALTTIAQPQRALGRRAAELLISRMAADAEMPARIETLPFSLVVRQSA